MNNHNSEIKDITLVLSGMLNTRAIQLNNTNLEPIDVININEWALTYKIVYEKFLT